MKIEFVCPAAEDSAFLKSLAVATLTRLTPSEIELSIKDDILHKLDLESDLDYGVDLAAITVSTKAAARAYQLADAYRHRGVKVVMGGIHPTVLPQEALLHCDAVIVGEAEGLWQTMIRDLQQGSLQRIYRHPQDHRPDFQRAARPDWRLFRSRQYIPLYTVQASRGCPFGCEFCSVPTFFGKTHRQRQVDDIISEIQSLDSRWIMFADDNIVTRRDHARRLFRAMTPLNVKWFGQASLHGLNDPQTIRLMSASGCRGLFVGFESINHQSLSDCGKHQNRPEHYLEIIQSLRDSGIAVWASFVLGLDHDTPDVFERTLRFAVDSKVFMALFAMQTPYPGTRLYDRLLKEGRLFDHRWWLNEKRAELPLYRPARMSPEQLHEGWQWIWKQFYSGRSILSRLGSASLTSLVSLVAYLPINLHQWHRTQDKILGGKTFFFRDA